ncbi:hypothetical protein GCM10025880_25890 [Methylorubrum aminovorans]|nr:hypothetical protein GCM10025880_25890 [Methylorubrum aminovorans]
MADVGRVAVAHDDAARLAVIGAATDVVLAAIAADRVVVAHAIIVVTEAARHVGGRAGNVEAVAAIGAVAAPVIVPAVITPIIATIVVTAIEPVATPVAIAPLTVAAIIEAALIRASVELGRRRRIGGRAGG